jgi:OOP family OmpA-OmpF porin
VAGGLTAGGLSNGLDVKGFGEKQPVAPNEINGADNPAGRALNRRVEIVLPIS